MTKDDIIKLAEKLSHGWWLDDEKLERFANLVAAHKAEVALAEAYRCGYAAGVVAEREACAKVCESHVRYPSRLHFATAIRARTTP